MEFEEFSQCSIVPETCPDDLRFEPVPDSYDEEDEVHARRKFQGPPKEENVKKKPMVTLLVQLCLEKGIDLSDFQARFTTTKPDLKRQPKNDGRCTTTADFFSSGGFKFNAPSTSIKFICFYPFNLIVFHVGCGFCASDLGVNLALI